MRSSDWSSDVCSSDLNWVIHRVWRKGRERSVEKAAQPKGQDFCGCRPGCKKFLNLWVGDRVRSSVRPLIAAYSEAAGRYRSEEHTSELQSLMRISYAVFCLKKKKLHRQTLIRISTSQFEHSTT